MASTRALHASSELGDRIPTRSQGFATIASRSHCSGLGNRQRTKVVSKYPLLPPLLSSAKAPLPQTCLAFFFLLLDPQPGIPTKAALSPGFCEVHLVRGQCQEERIRKDKCQGDGAVGEGDPDHCLRIEGNQ